MQPTVKITGTDKNLLTITRDAIRQGNKQPPVVGELYLIRDPKRLYLIRDPKRPDRWEEYSIWRAIT